MKKTKLLMPILGVAATAGMITPIAVACNPEPDKPVPPEPGETVTVAAKAVVGEEESVTGDTALANPLPDAIIGEDYYAVLTWTHWVGDLVETPYCYCWKLSATKQDGSVFTDFSIYYYDYGTVVFKIPADKVQAGLTFTVTSCIGEADVDATLNTYVSAGTENSIGYYPKATDAIPDPDYVYGHGTTGLGGMVTDTFSGLGILENTIAFAIDLPTWEEEVKKTGSSLEGMHDVVLYAERADQTRMSPSASIYTRRFWLGEKELSYEFNYDTYALIIHAPSQNGFTQDDLKKPIYGWMNFELETGTLNGGRLCALNYDTIPEAA